MYAINAAQNSWRSVSEDTTQADLQPGEELVEELPQWFLDQVTAYEVLRDATTQLNALTRQANAQVTAVQGRVTNLEWLIEGQDPEDPDYIEPTAEEVAELPVRKAQLKAWNAYTTKLGRVKAQATWPNAPVWPVVPEPYTSEMSARIDTFD